MVAPKLNRKRALFVLGEIEEILAREQAVPNGSETSGSSIWGGIFAKCGRTVLASGEFEVVRRIPGEAFPGVPQLRLAPEAYQKLREQVLARDGWRCQFADR